MKFAAPSISREFAYGPVYMTFGTTCWMKKPLTTYTDRQIPLEKVFRLALLPLGLGCLDWALKSRWVEELFIRLHSSLMSTRFSY